MLAKTGTYEISRYQFSSDTSKPYCVKSKQLFNFSMLNIRSLLLWLLMLALPMQGFAAASMLYCGMGSSNGVVQAEAMPASHHHSASAEEVNDTKHDMHGQNHAQQQSPDSQKQLPDAEHKCNLCAACCTLVGLSEESEPLTVAALGDTKFLDLLNPTYSTPSRLPERPPRA